MFLDQAAVAGFSVFNQSSYIAINGSVICLTLSCKEMKIPGNSPKVGISKKLYISQLGGKKKNQKLPPKIGNIPIKS